MMRRTMALGLLVGLAACQNASPPPGVEFARSAVPPIRLLQGTLSAPAGLVGLDSSTLLGLDASTLVGLDSASLLGLDGATLRSAQAQAVQAGTSRRLLSAPGTPLAGVPVVLAWPNGQPLEPRVETVTDANGRFSFSVRGDRYIAVALLQDAAKKPVRMRGFTDARGDKAQLDVTVASTLVVTGLLAEGPELGLAQMPVAAYEAVLNSAEEALPEVALPAALGDAALLEGYEQLLDSDQAVLEAVEAVRPVLQGPKEWFEAIESGGTLASQIEAQDAGEDGDGVSVAGQVLSSDALDGDDPLVSDTVLDGRMDEEPDASVALPPLVTQVPLATSVIASTPLATSVIASTPLTPTEVDAASDDASLPPSPVPQPAREIRSVKFRLKGNLARKAGCFAWMNTDLRLKPGDQVTVRASGKVSLSRETRRRRGPMGHPSLRSWAPDEGCGFPVIDQPLGMLVARVGKAGTVVPVGARHTFEVTESGTLRFAVNDRWAKDNKGHFDLRVTITSKL